MSPGALDAVVVGSGPNGLSAAVTLAGAGCSVRVLEARETVGGGARTAELTLPGYRHDLCSAVHPLGVGSPLFSSIRLTDFGLEWIHPRVPLAHPLDGEPAAVLHRSLEATAVGLDQDAGRYRRLMAPLVRDWPAIAGEILGPLGVPRRPLALGRFGLKALWPSTWLAQSAFRTPRGRALFAGLAAHSILPLERAGTSAIGLVLGVAGHAVGWPMARGGSQAVSGALAALLESLGGRIETSRPVRSLADLPLARVVLFDLNPAQVAAMARNDLPSGYRQQLEAFRHGPGAFKIDWALSAPIPWRDPACAGAGTVHLGGTLEELARSETGLERGVHPEHPYVLLSQPSRFDPARAPADRHTAWAYCHVPHGSTRDMTEAIEAQVERFAPGFRDVVLARAVRNTEDLQADNANLVGGDIGGGANTLRQVLARPVLARVPYATPNPRLFLCSASTPPGGGVHGMCGFHAARAALKRVFGKEIPVPPAPVHPVD